MGGIFTSLLLVFCVFTLLSISEVSAEDVISVNAESYQNTIIIEFKNDGTSKIKTVKIWLGGDATFKSFKTEPGWGGGEYADGKMLIFTATNTPAFGLVSFVCKSMVSSICIASNPSDNVLMSKSVWLTDTSSSFDSDISLPLSGLGNDSTT